MSLGDWIPTVHFKELNLLPRVLFSMGAIIFVAAVIAHDRQFVLFGAGIVFAALAVNFVVVYFRIGYPNEPRWVFIAFNFAITAGLAWYCLHAAKHFGSCAPIPNYSSTHLFP
jgi:hypothetical protein